MSKVNTDLKIDLNNLDKSDWKTYRFDEIAKNISERVDPNNTDLTVYIGLEHIDSESLHIKRNGTPDDVNGTKLKFYKGDIIFGRRRAYQRKAGIATWDGFCSAHALVLRANPDVIDPVLFPFFLHSDLFMNRAVDISVGSLSPTINWGTLKHQEFLLPPKELHSALAELIKKSDSVKRQQQNVLEKLSISIDAYVASLKNNCDSFQKIDDLDIKIIDGDRGNNYPNSTDFLSEKDGYCIFLSASNVTKNGFVFNKNQFISKEKDEQLRKGKLERNDIVITTRGTVGNIAIYDINVPYDHARINSGMVILRNISNVISTDFFYKLFLFGYFDRAITRVAYGTAQPQLSVKIVGDLKVPIFTEQKEKIALDKLTSFQTCMSQTKHSLEATSKLQQSLSKRIF
jgi:type I restriction enzyme S subunit